MNPGSRETAVGSFSLEEGHDTLIVRVTQLSPVVPEWVYSFALLTWRTSEGNELGTAKIYGSTVGETYRLSTGLPPLQRNGFLYVTPRAYNRSWISQANPPTWILRFEATSIKAASGSGDEDPDDGFGAGVAGAFADVATDVGLELIRVVFTSP